MIILRPRLPWFLAISLGFLGCNPGREGGEGDPPTPMEQTPPGRMPPGPLPVVATLLGKVLAPEGTIPISGALVYASPRPPEPIPDGVYCDRCVKIPDGTPYTSSRPDGTFVLPLHTMGPTYLIVQKGAFRRVRSVTVVAGDQALGKELTTLPQKTDKAAGDDIPRMAVLGGAWDKIEVSLVKLGLGKLGFLGVDKNSLSFDLFEDNLFAPPNDPKSPKKLLHDAATLMKYHIVFIPCSGSDGTTCNNRTSTDPEVKKNFAEFVARGGKLYVTDYSYDFVRQIFPGYVDWIGQSGAVGSACMSDSYDAPAEVKDGGMKEWLAAQGIVNFSLKENWTAVDKVNTVDTQDLDGKPAQVTPTVWVEGQTPKDGKRPATLSFVRACGRVLFSTYHTEADLGGAALLPQEKALLYVLLETAVCVAPPVLE